MTTVDKLLAKLVRDEIVKSLDLAIAAGETPENVAQIGEHGAQVLTRNIPKLRAKIAEEVYALTMINLD